MPRVNPGAFFYEWKKGVASLSFASAVVIFVTVWWALSVLFERKHDRDYPAFRFLMNTLHKEEVGAKRLLKPLFVLTNSFVGESRKQSIREQIKMAGLNSTPEEVLAAQVILGLGSALVMSIVAASTGNNNLLILSPIAGFIMFQQPRSMLKNKIKEKKKAIRNELPDFIDTLILLAEAGFTPYQAIKQAASYARGVLGSEVKEMIIEIEATSDEVSILKKFAERMQIPELRNFVAAMIQASTTDSAKAREIYAQQALFMREMRVSNMRKLIKELPGKVKGYNFLIFLLSIAIPLIPLVMMFIGMKLNFD